MDDKDIQGYRETVCAGCPGTLWGEKSICRVHALSIGHVDNCPEWTHHDERVSGLPTGQTIMLDLEPMETWLNQVEEDLNNFKMNKSEIERLKQTIDEMAADLCLPGSSLIAQYGLEAIMPKAQGKKLLEASVSEADYERMIRRLVKLEKRTQDLMDATEKITDDRERIVLDCLMAGDRMNRIAAHVGVSRQYLHVIKQELVKKLTMELYREEILSSATLHFGH